MPTLWVTGDSFSAIDPTDINPDIWLVKLAGRLGYDLANNSLLGSCQDWALQTIQEFSNNITPDDQLIVALTDPARFWFFEDRADMTNSHIIDFKDHVTSQQASAVRQFLQFIQRPQLDTRSLAFRLGWLNNMSIINQWQPPLIILTIDQYIPNKENYPNLRFSIGSLSNVSKHEEAGSVNYVGYDPRYNHLTLSNHEILTEKVFDFIKNGTEVDLTTGFKTMVFDKVLLTSLETAALELNLNIVQKHYLN